MNRFWCGCFVSNLPCFRWFLATIYEELFRRFMFDFKVFLLKRDRRDLLLQKARNLYQNLLAERPLAISGNNVLFEYNAQVVASDMPAKGKKTLQGTPKYGLALSCLVGNRQVDYVQNVSDGCVMTLSPITTPCCRNTFVIESEIPGSRRGEPLKFGEDFYLRIVNYAEPMAAPLYARYAQEGVPVDGDVLPIYLSSKRDTNCRWKTIPLYPWERLEGLLGTPVPTNTRLIIKNCIADKSLCVMNQNWMQTLFGTECGVTFREMRDHRKMYTAECIFMLISDIEKKSA